MHYQKARRVPRYAAVWRGAHNPLRGWELPECTAVWEPLGRSRLWTRSCPDEVGRNSGHAPRSARKRRRIAEIAHFRSGWISDRRANILPAIRVPWFAGGSAPSGEGFQECCRREDVVASGPAGQRALGNRRAARLKDGLRVPGR